jgi:parvulin-like peptidyl-prolyl isomerase
MQVLNVLFAMELAAQEAYRLGFAPYGEELVSLSKKAAEEFGGEEEIEKSLAESGSNLDDFRLQVARNEALKEWRNTAFLSKAKISEEEARDFYEQNLSGIYHEKQYRTVHIMFPLPIAPFGQGQEDGSRQKVRQRAQEALELAKAGLDFEDLMKAYMDETTMEATSQGNLGWIGKGDSFPEIEEAIFKLEPGETTEIIETPFSLHIAKVMEIREAGNFSFEEVKPEILELLFESNIDALVQEKLDELMASADIKILDPELMPLWEAFRKNDGTLPPELSGRPEPPISETPAPPAGGAADNASQDEAAADSASQDEGAAQGQEAAPASHPEGDAPPEGASQE